MLATMLAAGACVMALTSPAASAAGSVTVTTTIDGAPGSLREAIAHATPGETVILPTGNYQLAPGNGELSIPQSLTISGAGAATTTIDARTLSRVFHTSGAGSQITISGVTIEGGKATPSPGNDFANGGGILNDQATLTLSNDIITGNEVNADAAGSNTNGGFADGGGIYSTGTLNLIKTDLRLNIASANGANDHAGGTASGGGVFSIGTTTVRGSTIEINFANAKGGADPGGSVNQLGGRASGGGLELAQAGPTSISDTTLRDNVADGSAGQGAPSDVFALTRGGGAYLDNDDNSAAITQTNVTYVGNSARAVGGTTQGGGVTLVGPSTRQSLTNVTIFGNTATAGTANRGGNLFVGMGASATIENTIVTAGEGDPGAENCGLLGSLASLGHNVDSRDQCNFRAIGDLIHTDPLLAPPANNGGPVATAALRAGSPAIDAGAADVCPATDARGALRPSGGGCDIGAFEVATPSATTASASPVGANSAVLNGAVRNPDVAPGTAFFQYGTTTAYGASTAAQPVGPTTARLSVSAPVSGLSPSTTYHFRIVVRDGAGTVAGADQTLTTSPQGLGSHPPQLAIRSVSIAGATATLRVACSGTPGQRCSGTLLGKARVRHRGRSIVSIDALAQSSRRSKLTTKTMIVARSSYNVPVGRIAALHMIANATGKQLLARFYRLPAQLVFRAGAGRGRTITFAYPRVVAVSTGNWNWTGTPCAPCVTFVTLLTVTQLPTAGQLVISCHGGGCPFARQLLRPRRPELVLTPMFAHSRLVQGTQLKLLITARNQVAEVITYTMRAGTSPSATLRCLAPGQRRPSVCLPAG